MPCPPTFRRRLAGLLAPAASLRLAASVALLALALPGLTAPAEATTRLRHATIALTPRDPAAVAAYARAVSTPGSPSYRDYLTPRAFRDRFGAPPARVSAVRAALRARGLRPGPASAGGLSISVSGSAGRLRRGLEDPSASGGARVGRLARLPGVQAVIGLAPQPRARPLAIRDRPGAHSSATRLAPRLAAGAGEVGPHACPTAAAAAPEQSAYTDQEIAGAYDFDPLYAAGDEGQGVTVAVYELEPDDPADIAAYQRCYDTHAEIHYLPVDGGVGQGAGSDEAAFDIENLIGFAPRVTLLVYQGPNANSGLPGSGPYDLYSAIVNQDRAQVVSVSWGQCEAQLGRRSADAEHALFEQAAIEGQTIVAAAGDYGAEDCDTGGGGSSTRVAVDDPASQPGVLAVGGTTLRIGSPTTESVWNSGGSPQAAATAPGAGGGGISAFWPMGPDQLDAPSRLHVLDGAAAGPACGQRHGYCRESPDVAADADPATGYEIYWNGADTQPEPSGWQGLGGTSGASPLWAGLIALAEDLPACDRTPLGLVGGAIYRAAADHYASDFRDVSAGDNDFVGTDGGRWPATSGYDLATGLGTPRAATLAQTLCADALTLNPPATQSSALGAGVTLALSARDQRGRRLTFDAGHLPRGIRLQPATGRLIGHPDRPGVYDVRVTVGDRDGSTTGARFSWAIGGPVALTGVALLDGRLRVSVTSAQRGPALRTLRFVLPGDLRPGGVRQVHVTSREARTRVSGHQMLILLPASPRTVTVSLPVSRRPAAGAKLVVDAQAGSAGTSTLTARLP